MSRLEQKEYPLASQDDEYNHLQNQTPSSGNGHASTPQDEYHHLQHPTPSSAAGHASTPQDEYHHLQHHTPSSAAGHASTPQDEYHHLQHPTPSSAAGHASTQDEYQYVQHPASLNVNGHASIQQEYEYVTSPTPSTVAGHASTQDEYHHLQHHTPSTVAGHASTPQDEYHHLQHPAHIDSAGPDTAVESEEQDKYSKLSFSQQAPPNSDMEVDDLADPSEWVEVRYKKTKVDMSDKGGMDVMTAPPIPPKMNQEAGKKKDAGWVMPPSLEWDSGDLPPVLPPKTKSVPQKYKEEGVPKSEVQERWRKRHEELSQHSYTTITIPYLQQMWINEHDKKMKDRSYEEIAIPFSAPKGRSKASTFHSPKRRANVSGSGNVKEVLVADLPEGWNAVVENNQTVYWHVATGTIQFTKPTSSEPATLSDDEIGSENIEKSDFIPATQVTPSVQTRFVALYLGWIDVSEGELKEGNMVGVAQAAISEVLSQRMLNTSDVDIQTTDIERVYLEVSGHKLRVLHSSKKSLVRVQELKDIKVFGVGRDNERDMAYIALENDVNVFKCHVFRLDHPAQSFVGVVMSHLKGISSQTVKEITADHRLRHLSGGHNNGSFPDKTPPDDHGGADDDDDGELVVPPISDALDLNSVNVSRHECSYMGPISVPEAFGMHMVNEALIQLEQDRDRWMDVFLDISPQSIRIVDKDTSSVAVAEHRVRFISFLGIGENNKTCGYVLDCRDQTFQCYGFRCEPNCENIILALHHACQERYQHILETHPEEAAQVSSALLKQTQFSRSPSWFRRLTGLSSKRKPATGPKDPEGIPHFTMHYLGNQVVNQMDNSDEVKQIIATSSTAMMTGTVNLEVTSQGVTLFDPSKLISKRRTYQAKSIKYLYGKDGHMAFVVQEASGVYRCHVFKQAEYELDVRTIVSSIEHALQASQH